ncbi:MAG TPA: 16S rRNA (guanine(966)-N(2))-methyltransferase RsmD [Candidatus Kapabacteria bacterium]|nr:16S rRNA (guanine(966)-N(2))-methyltransferase RsmD [Candidatus Kapabacteria bacterium]
MRIVGGDLKGRVFKGKLPNGVRPTSELVRESLFNILNNLIDFEGITVLDLCAGTGALGIEAISRGADISVFVDINPKVCSLIKNITTYFNIEERKCRIVNFDALKITQNNHIISNLPKFDIIFFDPPYLKGIYNTIINNIVVNSLLSDIGLLVVESGFKVEFELPVQLEIIKEKKYGDSNLLILGKI